MMDYKAEGIQHSREQTMIGAYGHWATSIVGEEPPNHSYRNSKWTDIEVWRLHAKTKLEEWLARPQIGSAPRVEVEAQYTFDDLYIGELSWQLPYGPRTKAVFMKPIAAKGRLPDIVGLHDHAGNKYFGKEKITRVGQAQHDMMVKHQDHKKVYEKAGNAERYRCSFYPGPHKFDQEMQQEAFSWFDRWLK